MNIDNYGKTCTRVFMQDDKITVSVYEHITYSSGLLNSNLLLCTYYRF